MKYSIRNQVFGILRHVFLIGLLCKSTVYAQNGINCREPIVPFNSRWTATFQRHKLEVGAKIQFTCYNGFSLVGIREIFCQNNGEWSNPSPRCFQITGPMSGQLKNGCNDPGYPNFSRRVSNFRFRDMEVGTVIRYTCNDGLYLVGNEQITCQPNGLWSSPIPQCNKVPIDATSMSAGQNGCNDPGYPDFSRRISRYRFRDMEVGTVIKYTCNDGFSLNGNAQITCQANGLWSSPIPQCNKEPTTDRQTGCNDPGYPNFSRRLSTFRFRDMEIGTVITYTCNEGFYLVGNAKITCQENGLWSSPIPQCNRGGCNDPGYPDFSRRVTTFMHREMETGTIIKYTCNEGFYLTGNEQISCQSNGLWTGPLPNCKRGRVINSCDDPGTPNFSRRVANFRERNLEIGTVMEYTCNEGYILIGNQKVSCQTNGLWSGENPTCSKISGCRDTPLPANSRRVTFYYNYQFEIGAEMEYTCNDGYYLQGFKRIKCNEDQTWSSEPPRCIFGTPHVTTPPYLPTTLPAVPPPAPTAAPKPIICQHPGGVDNGNIIPPDLDSFNIGAMIRFLCDPGFEVIGVREVTCLANGSWTSAVPMCKKPNRSGCKIPETPNNVKLLITVSAEIHIQGFPSGYSPEGTKLTYTCQSEIYRLEGPETRYCLSGGTWSGIETRCVVECGNSKPAIKSFIVNGEIAPIGAWPWQVAISIREQSSLKLICGGALVSDTWVLTAAHCVTTPNGVAKLPKESFLIQVGKHFLDDSKNNKTVLQSRNVIDISIHEKYIPRLYRSDIAMIRLDAPVAFNEYVLPICFPTIDRSAIENSNIQGMVAGWGQTEEGLAEKLKHGIMVWTHAEECENGLRRVGDAPSVSPTVTEDMFCGKSLSIDTGWTCNGDSGGPLVYKEKTADKARWVIEGIVSWGKIGCASSNGVFVKVRYFLNWIKQFVDIDN